MDRGNTFKNEVVEIQVCSGCIASAADSSGNPTQELQNFLGAVQAELAKVKPEVPWSVCRTSCQRFCPPQRVTLVLKNRISMSDDTSVPGVVKEVLRHFP